MVKTRGKSKKLKMVSSFSSLASYIHTHVVSLNNSKFFAGLMIILLNIASKFASFKLSKSMESYLKFTFSRLILVFAIAWVGTRDIYTAIIICLVFTLCMDFLFNEESRFCCLPEAFTDYHVSLLEDPEDKEDVTIQDAIQILEKLKKTQPNNNNVQVV
ncbi:MAG: hypothetical protein EBU93_06555 [Chlamydiae bacterium]|nr:hypothetical protein [Chlamydiota bacterium]